MREVMFVESCGNSSTIQTSLLKNGSTKIVRFFDVKEEMKIYLKNFDEVLTRYIVCY